MAPLVRDVGVRVEREVGDRGALADEVRPPREVLLHHRQRLAAALEPLRQLGAARRIGGEDGSVTLPRLVAMRESPVYAGSDYAGVRRAQASVAVGVGISPLALGLAGMLALLGAMILAWGWEGRRR